MQARPMDQMDLKTHVDQNLYEEALVADPWLPLPLFGR